MTYSFDALIEHDAENYRISLITVVYNTIVYKKVNNKTYKR